MKLYLAIFLFLTNAATVSGECSIAISHGMTDQDSLGETHAADISSFSPSDCKESSEVDIIVDGETLSFEKKSASFDGNGRTRHLSPSTISQWVGLDKKGDILDFLVNDGGCVYGSLWCLEKGGVYRFKCNSAGEQIAEFVHASQFPEPREAVEQAIALPAGGGNRHLEGIQELAHAPDDAQLRGSNIRPVLDLGLDPVQLIEEHGFRSLNGATDEIDLMVAWTRRAECRAFGQSVTCTPTAQSERNMRSMIDQTVSETNLALENSEIDLKITLVHAYRESYDESTPSYVGQLPGNQFTTYDGTGNVFNSALYHLTDNDDGEMDRIHSLREQFGADMVALIIENDIDNADGRFTCGLAWTPSQGSYGNAQRIKELMFSVTKYDCLTGSLTFAHELGHNMGCNHDKRTSGQCGSGGFNYGYRDPSRLFRTVMSYNCWNGLCSDTSNTGSCMSVPYFSSDTVQYNGRPTGDSLHDNARQIMATKSLIAGLVPSVPLCGNDSECNDGDSCTVDACTAGRCTNQLDTSIAGCEPPKVVTTTFNPTHYASGAVFKITASTQDIEITGLDIHLFTGQSQAVEVLTKVDENGSLDNFVSIFNQDVISLGYTNPRSPTVLPDFASPVRINAGTSQWFWVRSPGGRCLLTAGTQLNAVYASDENLIIHEGYVSGVQSGTTVSSSASSFVWNGNVKYALSLSGGGGPSPTTSPPTPVPTLPPTPSPTSPPTNRPTPSPTARPTPSPTPSPTVSPTSSPVASPPSGTTTTATPGTPQEQEAFWGTTFDPTHYANGAVFKVTAATDIRITKLDIHLYNAGTVNVQVLTKVDDGSFSSPFATIFNQDNVVSQGYRNPRQPTPLPEFDEPVVVPAGTSQWFWVRSTQGKALITVGGSLNDVYTSNSELEIHVGYLSNQSSGNTLTSGAQPLIWNGVVHYKFVEE